MTRGIYVSKMSVYLVNSLSQTLQFLIKHVCGDEKRVIAFTCKPHSTLLQAPHKGQSGAFAFCFCICGAQGGCSRFCVE